MFCSQCGTEAGSEARYCVKCGASLTVVPAVPQQSAGSLSAKSHAASLSFGCPVEHCWRKFKGKATFPDGYEWLEDRNTLLVCPNHLILLQGDEKHSVILETIQRMGLIGGLFGITRNWLNNKKFELSDDLAARLFEDKLMVWCKKSDAIIWRYYEKSLLPGKSNSSEQLYCQFNSKTGILHACCVLWSLVVPHDLGNIGKYVDGVKIIDVGHNIPCKKISEAMAASRANLPG